MKKRFTPPHMLALFTALLLGTFSSSAQELLPQLNKAIIETEQGSIVKLQDFITRGFPEIEYKKVVLPGPQFIISDDPEYIRVPEAIALQEKVQPGSVRLYVYNVNGVKEPKMDRKITAVIQNTGKSPMHLRMLKYSSQKPSTNYYKIGKEGLADYFASEGGSEILTIQPGESKPIDPQLEKNIVSYDQLVHGFYEFVVDQPGEITILQTDPATSGPDALKKIHNILPPSSESGAGRGMFGVSNYSITNTGTIETANGAVQLIVADGELDPWVQGKESSTGKAAALAGNYGVLYDIDLKWKSTDGKGLALVTWNSRSENNQWCGGMAATMVVSEGKFEKGIQQLPKNELITRKAPEAILIQIFKPTGDGEEQTLKLTYSPPGASCLPTPLVFIPVDLE